MLSELLLPDLLLGESARILSHGETDGETGLVLWNAIVRHEQREGDLPGAAHRSTAVVGHLLDVNFCVAQKLCKPSNKIKVLLLDNSIPVRL